MIIAALMLSTALLSAEPTKLGLVSREFAEHFEAHEYRCPGGANQPELRIRYRLFVPRNMQPGEKYPLILWLHGRGEGGTDNQLNLRYMQTVLKDVKNLEQYRFFILLPQCPSPDIGWTGGLGTANTGATSGKDMLNIAYEILQKTMQEQPVDPDRISLLGICSGGSGCWDMAVRYPELFSAVAPMTPGSGNVSQANRLINCPIWAFRNEYTQTRDTRQMVAAVKQAGGNIHLTTEPNGRHDSWTAAIQDYDIIGWMVAQRRNAWICWRPPGHRWLHVLGMPVAFIMIVGLGWYSERRRRTALHARAEALRQNLQPGMSNTAAEQSHEDAGPAGS
jgi:predicted peptidase